MTDAKPSVAADILQEAARIVDGERNQTHGDKERSFDRIAGLWSHYLNAISEQYAGDEIVLVASDVAHMMVLLKMVRAICGEPKRDHHVDMCGYAAIAGELRDV